MNAKEEEELENMWQLRDRLGRGPRASRVLVPGPRATFVHIKVDYSSGGEDTDGEEEQGTGGEVSDGQ